MTYNVFGGTLNPTQCIQSSVLVVVSIKWMYSSAWSTDINRTTELCVLQVHSLKQSDICSARLIAFSVRVRENCWIHGEDHFDQGPTGEAQSRKPYTKISLWKSTDHGAP